MGFLAARGQRDYVFVPLFDGDLWIDNQVEMLISSLTTGGSYFRQARAEHYAYNGNSGACSFIEIELLEATPRS